MLADAYDELCRLRDMRPGGRIRLSDLHFQAFVLRQTAQVRQDPRRSRVKEYPRYQLAYDLSLLLADPDAMRRDGRRLLLKGEPVSSAPAP